MKAEITPGKSPDRWADSVAESCIVLECAPQHGSPREVHPEPERVSGRMTFGATPEKSTDSPLLRARQTRTCETVARIGFISDTHGRTDRARRAIELLLARGAEQIVHLGDVGSESVIDLLVGIPSLVVFGNCDDARSLTRYAEILGVEVAHPSAIIEVKSGALDSGAEAQPGLRLGVTHGHLESEVERLLDSRIDILLHGHTHEIRDELVHGVRILNPGALHRAKCHSVLLFDTLTNHATWLDVDLEAPVRD